MKINWTPRKERALKTFIIAVLVFWLLLTIGILILVSRDRSSSRPEQKHSSSRNGYVTMLSAKIQ